MKKALTSIAILLLFLSVTSCGMSMSGTPNENLGENIDPNSDPVIVVDTENVERKERYDSSGKHVGYYRFTSGTNCDIYGIVLLEYLDLDGNVLKSFSPVFAGCTIDYVSDDGYSNQITTICESSRSGSTSVEYTITPYPCGKVEMAIYTVKGITNQIDIYGTDGESVFSIKPSRKGSSLAVRNWLEDALLVWEFYSDEEYHSYTERELYFDSDKNLMCEVLLTPERRDGSNNVVFTRLELKNSDGQTKRVYEQSITGTYFDIGSYGNGTQFLICEYSADDKHRILYEIYDSVQDSVIYKEQVIHDNDGKYSHKDIEVGGGKVVITESEYTGFYAKLEFYDAQGNLRKTVETKAGEYIPLAWDKGYGGCKIEFYTEQGPTGEFDYYEP